ncbi:DNA cross-link repair protein pso2/snm1 [Psilocybe cubensis]|uniref:DNA repair metallo-beta-lactamase domain-containing protein n=2 Tax=Psilocybe cubensis TaxID=181762 RepID=A0A8H7XTC4_PSICU|nr:DNA cross-link repair protein pso2/snm1 [Psilocybe cubensis]KAH9479471.1 DNA cross-link repair protein pso2/snm1 [Psilocybe cubensis]
MAPPPKKKKREHSVSDQTLYHFFASNTSNAPQESASVKANLKTHPVASTLSVDSKTKATKQPEIIVIDSDSESEVEIVQTITSKRRKLSPKNDNKSSVSSSTKAEDLVTEGKHEENITISPSVTPTQSSREGADTTMSFGIPFLLNQPKSNVLPKDYLPLFGEPFLLTSASLEKSSVHTSATPLASSSKTTLDPTTESTVDIDLTMDDWNDGDDEINSEPAIEDQVMQWGSSITINSEETMRSDALFLSDDLLPDQSKNGKNRCLSTRPAGNTVSFPVKTITEDKGKNFATVRQQGIRNNAFSFLMSSLKENEIWKEATIAKDRYYQRTQSVKGGRQKAPFYKVLQGMPIAVDAFKYGAIPGVTAYFLTHAHSDHYTNLSSTWKHGPIYCSQSTANLIVHKLSVEKKWVHPLPMDTPTVIPDTNGVFVTLIEANHCPGSCLFFFEGCQTVNAGDSPFKSCYVGSSRTFRYLHCGDFRASPRHVLHPSVKGKVIDHVYLDTTYLDPKYTFPPQPLVISACANLAKRLVSGESNKQSTSTVLTWMSSSEIGKGKVKEISKPLIVIGTYSIGKERIAKAIARALDTKIYCDARKAAILRCQDDPELHSMLTSDPTKGFVHLVPLGSITSDQLKLYLDRFKDVYDRIIGFRPTGWTYTQAAGTNQSPSIQSILAASAGQSFTYANLQVSPKSTPNLSLYPVPYSEHSSFYELTCFAMSFTWVKMIATVNVGTEASRGRMAKWVDRWETERKKRGKDTIVPYTNPDYW